jgi:hypothetical protein
MQPHSSVATLFLGQIIVFVVETRNGTPYSSVVLSTPYKQGNSRVARQLRGASRELLVRL